MNTTAYDARDGLTRAWENVILFTPKLVAFLLILVVGFFVARVLGGLLGKVLRRVGFDKMVERGGQEGPRKFGISCQ